MEEIKYKFIKMDLTQFSPNWEQYDEVNDVVGINTEFGFSYNKTARVLRCETTLNFVQENKIFLKCAIQTFFEIEEDSVVNLKTSEGIEFPREMLCQFASLSYGSMRGVLYVKSINTPIGNLVLPPLYVDEVIKENLTIKL